MTARNWNPPGMRNPWRAMRELDWLRDDCVRGQRSALSSVSSVLERFNK